MNKILLRKLVEGVAMPLPDMTRRETCLPSFSGKAIAVTGIRRCGKSMFLWQCMSDRLKQGEPRETLVYLNFEDDRLDALDATHLDFLLEQYYERFPDFRESRRVTFFLDEIQLVKDWARFVRRVMDTEAVDFFLSGSSARLLSREIATALRGRGMEVRLFPFSFREACAHRGKFLPDVAWLTSRDISALNSGLKEYLATGGFPEAQGADAVNRSALLSNYVDVSVLRDVIERHDIKHSTALRWMVRHLLGNPAARFSIEKFYAAMRSQGMSVGKDLLHDYLGYLEDAFLVRTISIDSKSERQRMVNPRKAYPVDSGLIPIFDRIGDDNIGHALESAVAIELERRGAEIAYVKTSKGYEVDFVVRYPSGETELIQVCADTHSPDVWARETRALADAAAQYPKARRLLIYLSGTPSAELLDGAEAIPAYEWFCRH